MNLRYLAGKMVFGWLPSWQKIQPDTAQLTMISLRRPPSPTPLNHEIHHQAPPEHTKKPHTYPRNSRTHPLHWQGVLHFSSSTRPLRVNLVLLSNLRGVLFHLVSLRADEASSLASSRFASMMHPLYPCLTLHRRGVLFASLEDKSPDHVRVRIWLWSLALFCMPRLASVRRGFIFSFVFNPLRLSLFSNKRALIRGTIAVSQVNIPFILSVVLRN